MVFPSWILWVKLEIYYKRFCLLRAQIRMTKRKLFIFYSTDSWWFITIPRFLWVSMTHDKLLYLLAVSSKRTDGSECTFGKKDDWTDQQLRERKTIFTSDRLWGHIYFNSGKRDIWKLFMKKVSKCLQEVWFSLTLSY